jgi:hypothetical protein
MPATLQMLSRQAFGYAKRVRLNAPLLEAVRGSAASCELCHEIERDVEPSGEGGGDFVEAATFPGRSISKLDAHFRYHWKEAYALVDSSGRPLSS